MEVARALLEIVPGASCPPSSDLEDVAIHEACRSSLTEVGRIRLIFGEAVNAGKALVSSIGSQLASVLTRQPMISRPPT